MTCEIENNSKNDVRQVIFPDFAGLLPFCGKDRTLFRTGGFASLPFLELAPNEGTTSTQYMVDYAAYQVEYKAGGMFNPMFVRWMDLGGLAGGLSLFPKRWGWDPQVTVRLHLSETDDSLRLLCLHDATIKPGGRWESGEFVLTPHDHGWAKGIGAVSGVREVEAQPRVARSEAGPRGHRLSDGVDVSESTERSAGRRLHV